MITHNATTIGATQDFLKTIVRDTHAEADLLDLMSQLEYIGTRKILKSLSFDRLNVEILQHICEEASHAMLLKREANRVRGSEQSWDKGRFAAAGWDYFQTVDGAVSEWVGEKEAYRIVSWVIEERAKIVYPLYIEITRSEALRQVLKRILGEENRHSQEFSQNELSPERKTQIVELETVAWNRFMGRAIDSSPETGPARLAD